MTDERGAIVRDGYDAIAGRYLDWSRSIRGDPSGRFLSQLAAMVPPGGRVLDLGCGAGIPSSAFLAERFEVVGVDVSAEQLRRARANVPGATFLQCDLCELELAPRTSDAVTALYSISHVPRDRHEELFVRVAGWLKPGGHFLASLGATGSGDWTGEWLGVPMIFSSHDANTNRDLLRAAGFTLVVDEIVSMREPGRTSRSSGSSRATQPGKDGFDPHVPPRDERLLGGASGGTPRRKLNPRLRGAKP